MQACKWGVWQNEGLNLWHHIRLTSHITYSPPFSWAGVYTGGYLVTRNGAMRLLENLPVTSNIDTWVSMLGFYGSINIYLRCPELVQQGAESLTARGGPKRDKDDTWIEVKGDNSTHTS